MYFTAYDIKHVFCLKAVFPSAREKSHQLMTAHMRSIIVRVSVMGG